MSSDLTPARLEQLLATVSLPLDNRGRTSREKSEAIETLIALYATLSSRVIELEAEAERLNDQLVAQAMAGTPAATIETGDPCTLAECPIGLFYHGDELCMKTEYGNNDGRIDAFIVSSGEFFWGHAPETIASQRASIVTPAYASPTARAALETPNAD